MAATALCACSRTSDKAVDARRMDSLTAARDTVLGRIKAQRESLNFTIDSSVAAGMHSAPTPVRTDSDLRERPAVIPPTAASPAAEVARTAAAPTRASGAQPRVIPNPMTQRALALGDSIARAKAALLVGGSANGAGGDSVRGTIEIRGNAPRIVLKTANRTTVTLSGIATEGIEELGGLDVVVRGLKISSQDIVVKSFQVRSVKGVPALDGRLDQNAGGWTLTLSDNSGVKKLSAVPGLLQQAVGARVWITTAPNSNVPLNYGMILHR